MAYLFVVQGKSVAPNPETLLIEPFKTIWENDTSERKENAMRYFAFIEFCSSHKKSNPYKGYSNDKKMLVLKKDLGFADDWVPDNLIADGIRKILAFQREASVTMKYYESTVKALDKMRQFFDDFDLSSVGPRGNLLYKPKDITTAMKDTKDLLKNLTLMKKDVEEELYEVVKSRNSRTISSLANPDTI